MIDQLSTKFAEVQRECCRGTIGKQAYDQWTYGVLCGQADEPPAPTARPRRLRPAMRTTGRVGPIALAVYVIAQVGKQTLEPAGRAAAGLKLRELLGGEGGLVEFGRLLEAAKQIEDVVQPLGEVGPIEGAGAERVVGRGVEAREQGQEVGIGKVS